MQYGVSLETNEKDLVVKYGPYYYESKLLKDDKESALTSLKYIFIDLNDIRTKYVRLGFHLDEFAKNHYYVEFGYSYMEDFCAANLGMDKSAVSRCINVYRSFNASKSKIYENGVEKVGSAMELDDRYKEYSYSQLCEMVSMDDVQRKQVTPDMTIKQIREIKKNSLSLSDSLDLFDKALNVSRDVSPVATSQPEKFDFSKYADKKGIVLFNYIKSLSSEKTCGLTIFDQKGKEIHSSVVDLLYDGVGGIYIRLRDDNTLGFSSD